VSEDTLEGMRTRCTDPGKLRKYITTEVNTSLDRTDVLEDFIRARHEIPEAVDTFLTRKKHPPLPAKVRPEECPE